MTFAVTATSPSGGALSHRWRKGGVAIAGQVVATLAIPDNSRAGATNAIAFPTDLSIEAVQVAVPVTHTNPGDLGIERVSPSGTRSVLLNIRNGFAAGTGLSGMVLLSNAFYGERSAGTWPVRVVDGRAGTTGTFTTWQIRVFGR